MPLIDSQNSRMVGHVLIRDAETHDIILDKMNAIHYENMSQALAQALAHRDAGYIYEMALGNGASTVSGVGAITYFPPNTVGAGAQLYNRTFSKIVDDESVAMPSGEREKNKLTVQHSVGTTYADIVVTCTLNYNEPSGQEAFDDANSMEGDFVFDELGLVSKDGKLLTHVIFHPIQKSLNRVIEIVYTLRIYMT
jgi:hypothetical protein